MADYKHPEALSKIREHMRDGMLRWIERGILPGDFLTAVLENDLEGAVGRADHINQHRLRDFVDYLHNDAPSPCWGSPGKVRTWHERGGLHGHKDREGNRDAESP